MIDREHGLPITKQAQVLHISRGSVYYLPRPVSASDLEVMRRIKLAHDPADLCNPKKIFPLSMLTDTAS